MKSLLLRIGKRILATGHIDGSDVICLLDYNSRHPMWRATSDKKTVAAFDAIMAQVKAV